MIHLYLLIKYHLFCLVEDSKSYVLKFFEVGGFFNILQLLVRKYNEVIIEQAPKRLSKGAHTCYNLEDCLFPDLVIVKMNELVEAES